MTGDLNIIINKHVFMKTFVEHIYSISVHFGYNLCSLAVIRFDSNKKISTPISIIHHVLKAIMGKRMTS